MIDYGTAADRIRLPAKPAALVRRAPLRDRERVAADSRMTRSIDVANRVETDYIATCDREEVTGTMAIKAGGRAPKAKAGPKAAVRQTAKTKKASARLASDSKAVASHILSGPRGPREASHGRIKEAVEKVFRERARAHG